MKTDVLQGFPSRFSLEATEDADLHPNVQVVVGDLATETRAGAFHMVHRWGEGWEGRNWGGWRYITYHITYCIP